MAQRKDGKVEGTRFPAKRYRIPYHNHTGKGMLALSIIAYLPET